MAQTVKNLLAKWETWVRSLGWEDPLEEGMATLSGILTWKIPMDRGAWWAIVHWVAKSWARLSDLNFHFHPHQVLCHTHPYKYHVSSFFFCTEGHVQTRCEGLGRGVSLQISWLEHLPVRAGLWVWASGTMDLFSVPRLPTTSPASTYTNSIKIRTTIYLVVGGSAFAYHQTWEVVA